MIDDDPLVCDLTARFVTKLEFQPVTSGSGAEGFRLAKQILPSIIILDVIMRGMDGWAVLSKLKGDPDLVEISVIIVTVVDHETMGIDLGASSQLTKHHSHHKSARIYGTFVRIVRFIDD